MLTAYNREILEYELRRISSAPRIVPKLAALVKDPNLNPEDVIEVIRHDPALTTRLIAYCRSAAIHRGTEVNNVHDAVQCLGFSEVYRIAVVVAFRTGFCTRFKVYDCSADLIWQQAVAAACLMEEFAIEKDEELGTPYTIGLLHMIGMFLVDWHCSQIPGVQIANRPLSKQLELERQFAGMTHLEISAMALEFWGFPKHIIEPIRHYADPAACQDFRTRAAELQLAVLLSKELNSPTLKITIQANSKGDAFLPALPLDKIVPKVQRRLQSALNFLRL